MNHELATESSRKKLHDGGFLYTYQQLNADGNKKFWVCERKNDRCRGRIHTDLHDVVVYRSENHNHGSNAAGVEVVKVRTAMKSRALETMDQPVQIINNVIQGIDQAVMGQMPNKAANKKMIQRTRYRIAMAPPNPIDITALIIPDGYKRAFFNECMVLYCIT